MATGEERSVQGAARCRPGRRARQRERSGSGQPEEFSPAREPLV